MLIRTHMGISLDGFVATPDGLPAWDAVPTFGPGSHGTDEISAQCDTVVIGRTTFDQGFETVEGGEGGHWLADWPYSGKRVYVLTSRPLPAEAAALDVVASRGGPAELVAHLREAGLARDVHLLGGSRTVHAFLEIGAIDRLGIVVLPVLLGKGIPLFPIEPTTFSSEAWAASLASPSEAAPHPLLQLERHRAFPDGAVELVYRKGEQSA
jgi:dihydrofolate reductase